MSSAGDSSEAATPPEDTPNRNRWRAVIAALVTVIVGPPVGAIGLFTAAAIATSVEEPSILEALQQVAMGPFLGLMVAPVAYVLAGPAALLAGLLIGAWIWWGHKPSYAACVGIAIVSVFGIAWAMWFADWINTARGPSNQEWNLIALTTPPSIFAALVLRAFFGWFRWV